MNRPLPSPDSWKERFAGFDALGQSATWDRTTAAVVHTRVGPQPGIRYLRPTEEAVARALCERLLDLDEGQATQVVGQIDTRLAEARTDGWHYEDLPEDGEAWRRSLADLDHDARRRHGQGFASCAPHARDKLLQEIVDLGSAPWHGVAASRVWSLWTRYACTAFYAQPAAWSEMGFPGPAYPRGYKSLGVGRREPFEVADEIPADDPARGRA